MKKVIFMMTLIFTLSLGAGLTAGLQDNYFQKSNTIELNQGTDFKVIKDQPFRLINTAYADDPAPAPTGSPSPAPTLPVLPGTDGDQSVDLDSGVFITAMVTAMGGMSGLGALGIVALCVQLLMLFFRTPLASFAGKWKLVIVLSLSLVGGFLAQMFNGLPWYGALLSAGSLTAIQVLANQIWKQFLTDKGNQPSA